MKLFVQVKPMLLYRLIPDHINLVKRHDFYRTPFPKLLAYMLQLKKIIHNL